MRLVVEDQPALLTMVAALLRDAGHDVREAPKVAAALTALKESLSEAVVLDLSSDDTVALCVLNPSDVQIISRAEYSATPQAGFWSPAPGVTP